MPVLRLFAAAREAAGEARVELDGGTVGDVLEQARGRFGPTFTAVLDRSRIWVNGQPAETTMELSLHDVVAVLPPVSGGAGAADQATIAPSLSPLLPPSAPPPPPPPPDLLAPPPPPPPPDALDPLAPAPSQPVEAAEPSPGFDLFERGSEPPPASPWNPWATGREPAAPEPGTAVPEPAEWGTGGEGPSWEVGDPTPPPAPRVQDDEQPERDLWTWPEDAATLGAGPGRPREAPTPFAPSAEPLEWDRRWLPPAPEDDAEHEPPQDRPGGASPTGTSALDQPVVRILGPDPVARPAPSPFELSDEPAVRLLGPEEDASPVRDEPAAADRRDRPPQRALGVLVDAPGARAAATGEWSPPAELLAPDDGARGNGAGATAAAAVASEAATAPAPAPAKAKSKPPPLAVVPKANRPHGRLGFLWVGLTVGAVIAGPEWAGGWLALCAGVAALQTAKVWLDRNERPLQPLAGATAAALPLCAIAGLRAMTAAVVVAVVVTLLARLFAVTKAPARDVGLTLAIGVVVGLAVASVVLLRNINIQAPLLLLAFAAAYDAGAYLVGTGAASAWEGPAAGVATLIPVTMLAAVILVPPFPEGTPLLLGALAALLAPCGPLAGSAILGEREANAPALRRLDSLLVLAPAWAWCAAAFLT